jgi:hypothetical protein
VRGRNELDIPNVEKKLREASFFLSMMAEREKMAFGDREEFDFYLSAFLNAARSVDYRMRHEQSTLYKTWRTRWDGMLPDADDRLIKFFADDRAAEVHRSGSNRDEGETGISVENTYEDASGTVHASGPADGSAAFIIFKPSYYFTIDGAQRKVIEASGAYLKLLTSMIERFRIDNS